MVFGVTALDKNIGEPKETTNITKKYTSLVGSVTWIMPNSMPTYGL